MSRYKKVTDLPPGKATIVHHPRFPYPAPRGVNPEHLEPVTQAENNRRSWEARK